MAEANHEYLKAHKLFRVRNKRIVATALLVALLIAVIVFWWLKLVGITSTSDTLCNVEEHTHTSACYREMEPTSTNTDTVHSEKELICNKPEHTHSSDCFPEKGVDVEDSNDWKKSFEHVTITNNVAENFVAIGNSQLGYKESSENYEYDDAAQKQGYTRYGEWYGTPYGEWNTLFVSFCMNYANIKDSDSFVSASAVTMMNAFKTKSLYYSAKNHEAVRGDVVFFDTNSDNKADRTGIVAYNGEKVLIVTEGDVNGEIKSVVYKNTNGILGYGRTEKLGIAKYIEKIEEKTTETKSLPMELVGKVNRYIPKAVEKAMTFRLTRSSATENESLELMSEEDDHGISYSSNLENELTKVTFKDQMGVEITNGSTVYVGEIYKISLEFSEINKGADWIQFRHDENGYLTYQLPSNIHCERFDDWHTISAKTEQGTVQDVGEYFMDENGLLRVRFYNDANGVNFVDKFSNVDFTVDFSATVVATNPNGSSNIEFNDQFNVNLNVDGNASMTASKTHGDYNPNDHTIEYVIRVDVTHGVAKNIVIQDEIWDSQRPLRDTIVVTDLNGNVLDPQPTVGNSIYHGQGGERGFSVSGFPDCVAGDGFLIRYQTKIDDNLLQQDYIGMWNGLAYSATSPNGSTISGRTDDWADVEPERMTKEGEQTVITDANGNQVPVIKWVVAIRKDNSYLRGTVIIDTLGDGLSYYTGQDILIEHFDENGNPLPSTHISWNDVEIVNNSMTLNLPDGYAFNVVYYTNYEVPTGGTLNKEFGNRITATINGETVEVGGSANVVTFVPNLSKTARGNDGKNIYFTIETDVPSVVQNSRGFYISDFAQFGAYPNDIGALYVDNVPQNLQIKVTRKNGEVISFTPYVEGRPVENTYILVAPADGNLPHTFQIFFNTDVADVASSTWLMNEDVKLTVTYQLPFDTKTGTEWFGELTGSEAVGDVLLDGYTIANEAYLMYGNTANNATARASITYSYSPQILKNSIVHESGVIDYTVRFNNTIPGTIAAGYIVSGVEKTWFNDTFDERLEYVPGSLVVTTYSPWNKSLWISKYQYQGAVSGNTLHIKAEDFKFLDYNEASGIITGGSQPQDFKTYYQWMDFGGVYEFNYQLKVKDEYLFTTDYAKFELDNTAEVVWDDQTSGPATNTSEFYTGLLHKHVHQDDNKLDFEVHINREGLDVMEEADVLTVNDKMTSNLSVYWETIQLKYEKSPDVWVDFDAPESEYEYTITYDAAQNMLTFIVPDNLHIIIEYTTLITESGYVEIENAVLVDGKEEVADKITAYFRVQEHSGDASGFNYKSTLLKHDGLTNAALPGAQFLLYGPKGDSSAVAPNGVNRTLVIKEGTTSKELKYIGCYTTGEDGTTVIESQFLTDGGPYALVEYVAPDGYERLEDPVLFYFYDPDPNGLLPTYTTLIPIENFSGSFIIPETGGIGAFPLATIGFALVAFPILYCLIRRKRERRLI